MYAEAAAEARAVSDSPPTRATTAGRLVRDATGGDLKDNITITVIGVRQADGSIKAAVIQIGSGAPSSGLSNQSTSQ
ncbi:MAG TPA: hypothetical protein VJR46_14160 [Candidatus Dormibacteraeota bacterium]|nr:hypothetical protein [Candidatus Dormibacteraeota bacterium]